MESLLTTLRGKKTYVTAIAAALSALYFEGVCNGNWSAAATVVLSCVAVIFSRTGSLKTDDVISSARVESKF